MENARDFDPPDPRTIDSVVMESIASVLLWVWNGVQAGRREPPRGWESETEIRWREPLVEPCDGYRERGLHALPTPASSFPWTWERAWGDEGCAQIFWRTRDL